MRELTGVISQNPYYRVNEKHQKPVIVFDDHRFVVPVLWLAKKLGITGPSMSLVRFDGHYDALPVGPDLIAGFGELKNFDDVVKFCAHKLGGIDDDWQSFAFEAELVEQSLIFCGREDEVPECWAGRLRRIKSAGKIFETPGAGMGLHKVPLVLDIDCDYFTYHWQGKIFPWTDEQYDNEFSSGTKAGGRSVLSWLRQIIEQSPFVTVSLEPDFCGGRENSLKILDDLKDLIFNR